MTTTFAGCHTENAIMEDVVSEYDVIDTNAENTKIEPQILDVEGEDFKLVVEYSLDESSAQSWHITDTKKIITTIYTQGLDENTKVYIDNIHTDVTLVASKPEMDGITQDSMDDRIHNSLMYGFPIDNTTVSICINEIEGQNNTFISGSAYGFNGYVNGTITERRHSEEEYLEKGVFGNRIASVCGLLIQKGNNEPYGVDVSTNVIVLANNVIKKDRSDGAKIERIYNIDGTKKEIIYNLDGTRTETIYDKNGYTEDKKDYNSDGSLIENNKEKVKIRDK